MGLRRFLYKHEVRTFGEMPWHPQLENGDLLNAADAAGFEVLITADQNIRYQQNLTGRKVALIVLGSNLWPIVRGHAESIAAAADTITAGSYHFIEMPLPDR